jgi:Bacteriophage head to tail connecting protein.
MYTAFNRSNFQQDLFELYRDLLTFGTACMFIEEDDDDIIKFSTTHINEVFIAENDTGRIDPVFKTFTISARAAVQKFGDNVSSDIQGIFKKDPYEEVEILPAVYPRSDFNPKKKDKANMPI